LNNFYKYFLFYFNYNAGERKFYFYSHQNIFYAILKHFLNSIQRNLNFKWGIFQSNLN
jgi:hypothetical protein